MILHANAKINFGLFITGKRPDGYHELESIFLPVSLCDVLELAPSHKPGIQLRQFGISIEGASENNIVVKAYQLLEKQFSLPGLTVNLLKNIPTGAGLGGGSSDGAFMLKALNQLFELGLSEFALMDYAAKLGSDCPFFIANKAAYVSGRGENIMPIEDIFSGSHLVLVNPGIHASTAEAFSRITPRPAGCDLRQMSLVPRERWQSMVYNDFEPGLITLYPVIGEIIQKLKEMGAYYVSMSGSGSSVYGFFENEVEGLGPVDQYFARRLEVL